MSEYVGIDVSKNNLDVHFLSSGKKGCFRNNAAGINELVKAIGKDCRIVLEATGGYERYCLADLREAGREVWRINPKRARDFARGRGILAKTDEIDAKVLALYGANNFWPQKRVNPSKQQSRLRELQVRRRELVEEQAKEKTRLKQPWDEKIKESIKRVLQFVKEEIERVEEQIEDCISNDQQMKEHAKMLEAIPGVGKVLRTTLLGQLPELGQVGNKQIAALVGVAPYNCDSGHFRGKRKVWGGRSEVRGVLYMAALTLKRTDPEMRGYYEQLRERGKPFKVAMVACMHKFLSQLNAKMRDYLLQKNCEQTVTC
jgi:transposase